LAPFIWLAWAGLTGSPESGGHVFFRCVERPSGALNGCRGSIRGRSETNRVALRSSRRGRVSLGVCEIVTVAPESEAIRSETSDTAAEAEGVVKTFPDTME
jgi:hypothetical protein